MFLIRNPYEKSVFVNLSNVTFFYKSCSGIRFEFGKYESVSFPMSEEQSVKFLDFLEDKACAIEYKE